MQEASSYPVRLKVQYPESLSKLLNFPLGIGTLIKGILAIPSLIVWYVLLFVAGILVFLATFVILFTGRFPRGMFNFTVEALRLQSKVYAYLLSLTDAYPGFSGSVQLTDPVGLEIDYPESLNRILNFPLLGMYIKAILVIPHLIILIFAMVVAYILFFVAQFAILFSGRFPEGMFNFMVGTLQFATRVTAYTFSLTDKYPPFSLSPNS